VEDVEQAQRLADKLWKVVEITKQDKPQPSKQVVIEAPKGERERVTLYGEEAVKLILGDVIKFKHTATSVVVNSGSQPWSAHDLKFERPSWGKTRWTAESFQ
jgi:hypothetical protein